MLSQTYGGEIQELTTELALDLVYTRYCLIYNHTGTLVFWKVAIRSAVLIFLLCFAALLPGAELWYDCFLCADDLERTDGCHWQWESNCCCSQVSWGFESCFILNIALPASADESLRAWRVNQLPLSSKELPTAALRGNMHNILRRIGQWVLLL